MNSEKILIEINVAGVNRSFDCIVPRTLSAKLLCRGFLELVEESMGIPFGAYRQALLMSERTGCILSPEQTLDDADIDSGDTLYLVWGAFFGRKFTVHRAKCTVRRHFIPNPVRCVRLQSQQGNR